MKKDISKKSKISTRNLSDISILIAMLVAILGLTYFSFVTVTKNVETKIKKELLDFTKVVNASIDPLKIDELSGTNEDYQNPEYIKLKNKLIKMGDVNQSVRYIYIVGERNGELFFYIDSQPTRFNNLPGTEPTAFPGESYVDDSGTFYLTLNDNREIVSDAYTDKWGTFISVSVPIIDVANDRTVAMLGVDMNLVDFQNRIQVSQAIVLIISFAVILILVLGFLYLRNQKKYKDKMNLERQKIQKYLDMAPILLLGLNTDGKIVMINKTGCEILEGDRSEIVGKNWFDNFLPKEKLADVRNLFKSIVDSGAKFAVFDPKEGEVVTLKGNRKIIFWNNNVIRDEGAEVVEIISSGQDITNKNKKEIEITKSNEELSKLNKLMIGRELEMINLKKELLDLKNKNK
jgi:PAS domain S-box-containing protein